MYEIELMDFLEVKIDFFDTLDVDKDEQLTLEEVIKIDTILNYHQQLFCASFAICSSLQYDF